MLKSTESKIILPIVCLIAILLLLPIISNNIDDPNMIFYFGGADEDGLMDLIWLYYSGEIRDSRMGELDYRSYEGYI